jgi:cysteine desulfurase family protein (TIGR01976 family)
VNGKPAAFFDGPAGSQVPQRVIDAIGEYLASSNANCGGVFATSRETDAMLVEAHRAVADLLGTDDPDTVAFGPNMTTLTLSISRALSRGWRAGDEIVITQIDHDANYTPWVLAAKEAGAIVKFVPVRPEDCTLDMAELEAHLGERTRLVAVACAANAVVTIQPIREIVTKSHAVGAEVFVDAVHYAPHALMDVTAWDCDYLVCSAYKFFGPHVGVLWGKRARMEELPVDRLRPAPATLPGRWMTGTQSHEGISGTRAAVDYLAELGRHVGATGSGRRAQLEAAYEAITAYENSLATRLVAGLQELRAVKVWGITDPGRFAERVPTVSFAHAKRKSGEIAALLAERGVFVWAGNFYALPLTEALDLEPEGLVRVGLLHYNTEDEIERLLDALRELE